MQLRQVDEVDARGEDGVLLAQEGFIELRGHGRLHAHEGDMSLGDAHGLDHAVRAAGRAQVEAQLVQAGAAQFGQVLFIGQRAVGVHVLIHARLMEPANDGAVFLNLHEGLQIHIRNAGGLLLNGQKQVDILCPELRAADFPHALAHGRKLVHHAIVVAEFALQVAFVGLAHGAQTRAREAGAASGGKPPLVADEKGAPADGLQPPDLRLQPPEALVYGLLDLGKHRPGNLLLPGQKVLVLRQLGKKAEPGERILLGYLHA